MADDAKFYRDRAEVERVIADGSTLDNVRDRSLRAAERWDQLADRAEKGQAASIERAGAKAAKLSPLGNSPA